MISALADVPHTLLVDLSYNSTASLILESVYVCIMDQTHSDSFGMISCIFGRVIGPFFIDG